MKKLYLIGGPIGVGKTTIGKDLCKILPNSVYLDGDWCWNASPFVVNEETKKMVMDNIGYLLQNFINCRAYENIIFSWVMHKQAIIDEILSRLKSENLEVIKISLVASEDELKIRLTKDVNGGYREKDVIDRSIQYLAFYEKLDTIKINTTGRTVQEIINDMISLGKNEKEE